MFSRPGQSCHGIADKLYHDIQGQRVSNSLMAWWRFDNDASAGEDATHIRDWSVKGHDLIVSGAATPDASGGKFGGSFNFDGSTSRCEAAQPTTLSLKKGESYTFSAWVKMKMFRSSRLPKGVELQTVDRACPTPTFRRSRVLWMCPSCRLRRLLHPARISPPGHQ